jgi:hypothetical protein
MLENEPCSTLSGEFGGSFDSLRPFRPPFAQDDGGSFDSALRASLRMTEFGGASLRMT